MKELYLALVKVTPAKMKMMHSFLVLLVEVKEYLCAANFLPPAPWTSLVQVHRGGLGPLYFHC